MKTLEDYLKTSEHGVYHRKNVAELSEAQQRTALEMAHKLEAAGCDDPLSWVMSELRENIAQTARFGMLREMFQATQSSPAWLEEIGSNDQRFQKIREAISAVIPESDLEYFTRALCKGFGFDFLMLLDDCPQADGMPSWNLKECDAAGNETGRFISGLHEDYEDFALREDGVNHG
jgi:hypothetical protein